MNKLNNGFDLRRAGNDVPVAGGPVRSAARARTRRPHKRTPQNDGNVVCKDAP